MKSKLRIKRLIKNGKRPDLNKISDVKIQKFLEKCWSKDPKESENKKDKPLDIINPETLAKMRRIKSIGGGEASEVFEVVREEHLALKVYYPELYKENDDDDDDLTEAY